MSLAEKDLSLGEIKSLFEEAQETVEEVKEEIVEKAE